MVFIHVIQGRPSGLLQFPAGGAVKVYLAEVKAKHVHLHTVGCQLTLCDPISQVTLRSSEMGLL